MDAGDCREIGGGAEPKRGRTATGPSSRGETGVAVDWPAQTQCCSRRTRLRASRDHRRTVIDSTCPRDAEVAATFGDRNAAENQG